jgi:hypothetical protein
MTMTNPDFYMPLVGMVLGQLSELQQRQEEWKERIRKQWEESKNLPRKKKKQLRKSLLLDWNIASFNIFGGLDAK